MKRRTVESLYFLRVFVAFLDRDRIVSDWSRSLAGVCARKCVGEIWAAIRVEHSCKSARRSTTVQEILLWCAAWTMAQTRTVCGFHGAVRQGTEVS